MRLTIFCPEVLIADANHFLAVLFAEHPALELLGVAGWEDQSGTRYAVASLRAGEDWQLILESRFARPWWDDQNQVHMDAATRIHDGLQVVKNDMAGAEPLVMQADRLLIVEALERFSPLSGTNLVPIQKSAADG